MRNIKLNLGAGNARLREGYVTLDANPAMNPDIVATVPPIPLEDESVDAIYCSHLLEHLTNEDAALLMAEIWRVLKVGAGAEFISPYALGHQAWQDPHHKSFWLLEKFLYFTDHMRHLDYGYETRFIWAEPFSNSEEVRVTLIKTATQESCNCYECANEPIERPIGIRIDMQQGR